MSRLSRSLSERSSSLQEKILKQTIAATSHELTTLILMYSSVKELLVLYISDHDQSTMYIPSP